jgi:hypothetical protein
MTTSSKRKHRDAARFLRRIYAVAIGSYADQERLINYIKAKLPKLKPDPWDFVW